MADLVLRPAPSAELAVGLAQAADDARAFASAAFAENTRIAYAGQWARFEAWCRAHELAALPAAPETVALYLASLARRGLKAASIRLATVAIGQAHVFAGQPSPRHDKAVVAVLAGIRRTLGTAQRGKAPMLGSALKPALEALPAGAGGLSGLRDRALLLLGWHASSRRSELVGFDVAHVRVVPQGLELLVARSKTDQEGKGRWLPVPRAANEGLCPQRVLLGWLAAAGITEGPLFRPIDRWGKVAPRRLSGRAVAEVVKRAAALAGLDPKDFAGHSLRAGFVTDAARQGRAELAIMQITGHVSVDMLRRYFREANLWRNVASAGLLEGSS